MNPPTTAKPTAAGKPIAAATVELRGSRTTAPRDHLVKVLIELRAADGKQADELHLMSVAHKALAGFAPAGDEPDRRRFEEISARTIPSKTVPAKPVKPGVIAVEASVTWPGRPGDGAIQELRAALAAEGYRVTVRETRECSEHDCASDAMVEWNRPLQVPAGWYSSLVCGKHDYKTCGRCKSIYLMTSTNAAGQAPSLRCEVCGLLIIEWGSTKLWSAQLVTRGDSVH
jgi:hypothetical protein